MFHMDKASAIYPSHHREASVLHADNVARDNINPPTDPEKRLGLASEECR